MKPMTKHALSVTYYNFRDNVRGVFKAFLFIVAILTIVCLVLYPVLILLSSISLWWLLLTPVVWFLVVPAVITFFDWL